MRGNGGKRRRHKGPVLMKVRSSLSVYTFADGASFILGQHPVRIHHQIYAQRPEPSTFVHVDHPWLVTTKDDMKAKASKILELERGVQSMLSMYSFICWTALNNARALYQCEPVPSFLRTHLTPAFPYDSVKFTTSPMSSPPTTYSKPATITPRYMNAPTTSVSTPPTIQPFLHLYS